MKGYFVSPKGARMVARVLGKKVEVVDNVMLQLKLDNELVEIPLQTMSEMEFQLMAYDYEQKGWKKVYMPENPEEVKQMQQAAKNKGLRINFKNTEPGE